MIYKSMYIEGEVDDGIRDMYLAAAILSYGGKISHIDRQDSRRQVFYFDVGEIHAIYILENGNPMKFPNPKLEDIKLYAASQTLFLPPTYPASLRSIKSAIHN